jgi:hypothetical protein
MTTDLKQGAPLNSSPHAAFRSWRAFARHWRESVRYFGWWRSARELAGSIWGAFLELLPTRRKARFGDLDYDWEHSVDTTRSNVGAGTQFLAGVMGRPYFATEPWLFEQIMDALVRSIQQPAVSHRAVAQAGLQDFTFIDLGSGKGRVLLMASDYPFKRIIGVEFMPELHRVAEKNITGFASDRQQCRQIETVCMDARDFQFPLGPLVVYVFNPFSEATFAQVLENLSWSVEQNPRRVYVAYRFPEFDFLLQTLDWLEKIAEYEQWSIFASRNQLSP